MQRAIQFTSDDDAQFFEETSKRSRWHGVQAIAEIATEDVRGRMKHLISITGSYDTGNETRRLAPPSEDEPAVMRPL